MVVEAKVRKIGTGFGILIPKKTLEEVGAREGTVVIVKRIERPVKEIRGILKGSRFRFERRAEDRDPNDRHQ
jgi:antitoxin component of MazEF toxin-antitoxin module